MKHKRDGKSRWDKPFPNHNNEWHGYPWQPAVMPPPSNTWQFPQGQFSELAQFQSAYQSDRYVENFDDQYWNQSGYQAPHRNDFLNNSGNNWESGRSNSQNPRPNRPYGNGNGFQSPFPQRNPSSNSAPGGSKKTCSVNRPHSRIEENYLADQGPSNSHRKESYRGFNNERPSFQSEQGQAFNKKENNVSPLKPFEKRPNVTLKPNGKSLNERGNCSPQERRGNNGHYGRGLLGQGPPGNQNSWNRKTAPRKEDEDDDEKNEINHWLQISKGQESRNEIDRSPRSKDPLPGSEEERNNAIKEATDRVKQALKQKKKGNFNELLSSGDEAKGDSQANNKQKSFPQNLAQLELDASDMREIGRANTEKSNCVLEDHSDDDIMEVARPPTPVRPVIDLDVSPTKDYIDNSEKNGYTLQNGNVTFEVKNCSKSQSEFEIAQSTQEDVSESNRNLTETFVTNSSLNLECSEGFNPNCSPNNNSFVSKTIHLNECRNVSEACSDIAELSTKPVQETNHLSQSDLINVNNMKMSCRGGSLIQSESETTDKSLSAVSSCVSGKLSSDTNTTSSVERASINLTVSPPSSSNQRRRRNSSACESPSYRSPRLGNLRPQQTRSSAFEPRSPPFLQRDNHDSRQKKIISDLQKMSQSKLKDLINNPRSGKLDFAVKQLMKEHQAAISRKSRDVAEKRIPVEFLNPKSSDLPPDDSALLADFAIDWSSLPGELISTLGDLFQDFNSESTTLPVDSQLQNSGQETKLTNFPACDEDLPLCYTQNNQEERNSSSPNPIPTEESTPSVKIRVRQFARENLFSLGRCDEMNQDPTENTNSALLSGQEEPDFVECVSGENSLNAKVSNITAVTPELFGNACVQQLNLDTVASEESSELQGTHQHSYIEVNSTNPATLHHGHGQKDVNFETSSSRSPIQLCNSNVINLENSSAPVNNLNDASIVRSNLKKASKINKSKNNSPPNQRKPYNKESPKSSKKNRHKQKRLVHLEERSWFEDAHSEKNVTTPIEPSCNSNENTTGNEDNQLSNQDNGSDGEESTLIVNNNSNILPVDKQCVSMLPVLMMTVPADGLPDVVCNMSVTEMQKRLAEIDIQLQSLVQERFILSQALKASQSSVSNSEAIAIPSAGNNQTSTPTQEINTVQSSLTSTTVGSSVGQEMTINCNIEGKKARVPKRKSSKSDDKPSTKKRKSDKAHHLKTPANATSMNSVALVKDCVVQLEKICPSFSQNEQNKNKSDVIVLDDEEEDKRKNKNNCSEPKVNEKNDDKNVNCENAETENIPLHKASFIKVPEVEGNILDMRIHYRNIYAASQNGLLYCFSVKHEIQAIFGQKSVNGCTAIEVVENPGSNIPYVFTGSGDGILRVYKTYKYPSKKHIQPDATLPISNAIHCMETNWDMLYMGTKAGSIVPFSIKNGSVGEPISLGGYPVLAIKSCMEGPRKVLIVSCRHQPLAVRDAVSGLLLRTIGDSNWNVYSIALYKNWVLCGSNSEKISVFDFQSGEFVWHLPSGMGVIDMKIIADHFLFCGCYDGRIFTYDLEQKKMLYSIQGPGKMVLCIQIFKKKIICSSKDNSLSTCKVPKSVLRAIQLKNEFLRNMKYCDIIDSKCI